MDRKEKSKRDSVQHHAFRRRTDTEKNSVGLLGGEAELRMAVEATGLGIVDYYPLTGELHWSHTAKAHFGLSVDAHVNYNVFLVGLHPDDRERVDRLVHDALQRENEGKYSTEYRTIGIEDGKERWIEAHGQAFFNDAGEAARLIGTTLEITMRKRLEDELRASEERYRLLFDRSPLPKWVVDLDRFVFLEVNAAAVERYGYSREEFANLTLADIRSREEFEKFKMWADDCRAKGMKLEGRVRTKHRTKTGAVIETDALHTEISYKGRRAALAVLIEIDEPKRTEP